MDGYYSVGYSETFQSKAKSIYKRSFVMKRAFGLFLVIVLVFTSVSMVAGQGDMSCPEGTATINVTSGAVGAELEESKAAGARYTEMCPNITVNFVEMPDSTTDRLALYQQFWAAQSGDVDLYQVDVIWAGIIADAHRRSQQTT